MCIWNSSLRLGQDLHRRAAGTQDAVVGGPVTWEALTVGVGVGVARGREGGLLELVSVGEGLADLCCVEFFS